ncbi:MAG: hypothetical protein Q8N88_03300 [Nanoarchaeota archaeon]|nr:hypothetical protein [Nanoarchaeota archaeon]
MKKLLIGFIGQGFIGKNYADDFEKRGYKTTRYSVEEKYKNNKEKIKECDVVFIAVPTPTTPNGFNDKIVREAVKLVGYGKIAVIKSTILPGLTESIQKQHPKIFVFHSPEFLTEANAVFETANPERNIIGIPKNSSVFKKKAKLVMSLLPKSPYSLICSSQEAELIKYAGNSFFYLKIVFMNILYDYSKKIGANWDKIAEAVSKDSRIGRSHMKPYHKTSGKIGRGAGGHCFMKDFEAFIEGYSKSNKKDILGINFLKSVRDKNLDLLISSKKDLDLIKSIYSK